VSHLCPAPSMYLIICCGWNSKLRTFLNVIKLSILSVQPEGVSQSVHIHISIRFKK
jgi:hypothetical protein